MSETNERSVASTGSVDIVERLRILAVEAFALPLADDVDFAADEIERLRITDRERLAIRDLCDFAAGFLGPDDPEIARLRRMLERLK